MYNICVVICVSRKIGTLKKAPLSAVIDKTVIIADRLPNGIAKNRHATF